MLIRNIWQKNIKDLQNRYNENLITVLEFNDDIKKIVDHPDSPLWGLLFSVTCETPFEDFDIGVKINGDPTFIHPVEYTAENREVTISIKSWYKESAEKKNFSRDFQDLFEKFWKPAIRASPSGLISIKDFQESVSSFAQNRLDDSIKQKKPFSILYADLDHFGEINNQIGEQEGDNLIRKVAALLEKNARNNAIPLNNGGDEYVLVIPNGSSEDAILLAYEIKKQIHIPEFKYGDIILDMSIGIDTNNNFDSPKSISDILNNCSKLVKKEIKTTKKGLTRVYKEIEDIKIPKIKIADALNLSLCVTKCGALNSTPYQNIWLNAISKNVSYTIREVGFSTESIQDSVSKFVNWVEFNFDDSLIKTAFSKEEQCDVEPIISHLDICISTCHGILYEFLINKKIENEPENNETFILKFNDQLSEVALILSSGSIISTNSSTIEKLSNTYNFGYIWNSSKDLPISPKCLCVATLIKIGHEKILLPSKIFDEIIIVDDRPVKGGGLPDFWELTIARLIDQLSINPNISEIFLIGNQQYASRTIEKLKEFEKWDDWDIQRKTGIPIHIIKETKKRLNHFSIVKNEGELLNKLACAIQETKTIVATCTSSFSFEMHHRFLKRDLILENLCLTKNDGCNVGTIREAFPIMLEIARNSKNVDNTIIDQAGRQIQELVDFKVLLNNPSNQCVPDFYANEKKSLDDYFRMQFLDETNGLFGKIFKENDQLERVLNHTVEAIKNVPPYATRRSILVVPHKPSKDFSPLGLVSIRIIPRFNDNKITLNYSYTWRTVEALVGFPYSIYGSVKYGEYLTEEIKQLLPAEIKNKVNMGFVSYIAHSLHIFSDEYSQNIARGIISDASI
jgi:diguanylate cyclase (GGDEF)-like protein